MSKFSEGNPQEPTEHLVDVGRQLRRAREAGNLSIQSVAASLHLSPRVIIALEENNFGQFQPVFVKGYLRNYGRLLSLPTEPLVESYSRAILPDQAHLQTPQQNSETAKPPWGLYLLLVVGVLSVAAWAGSRYLFSVWMPAAQWGVETGSLPLSPTPTADGNKTPEGSSESLPNGQGSQPGDNAESAKFAEKPLPAIATGTNELVDTPKPESTKAGDEKTANASSQAAGSPAASSPPESLGPDTIAIHLSATAWVGIRDHAGRRLVYKKIPAGTDQSFTGQAPFLVVLGNAPATRIEFNGKPFTPPKSKAGAVAKFTIGQTMPQETEDSTVHKNNKKRP